MELIVQILKQLPPFWPRLLVLIVLVLLVALPQTRRLLTRGGAATRRLERAKLLLEVRKLQLEVEELRVRSPEGPVSVLDAPIERLLAVPVEKDEADEASGVPVPWRERLHLAALGAAAFLVLDLVAFGVGGRRAGLDLVGFGLKQLVVLVPCALLASAIPTRNRWGPVFYAFLLPVVVAALVVTARLQS